MSLLLLFGNQATGVGPSFTPNALRLDATYGPTIGLSAFWDPTFEGSGSFDPTVDLDGET